jgi:hypothetical protein
MTTSTNTNTNQKITTNTNTFSLDILLNSNKDALTLKVSDTKYNVYKTVIENNHNFVSAFLSSSVEKLLEIFNTYGYQIEEYDNYVMVLTKPPLNVKFALPLINNLDTSQGNPESETIKLLFKKIDSLIKKVESLDNTVCQLNYLKDIVIIPEYPLTLDINTKELFFNFSYDRDGLIDFGKIYNQINFDNNNYIRMLNVGHGIYYSYHADMNHLTISHNSNNVTNCSNTIYKRTDFLNIDRLVNLEILVINFNYVSDLGFLAKLTKLKILMLVGLPNLTNLDFINKLVNLEELYIAYCDKLLDIPIKKSFFPKLTKLGISKSKKPDLKVNGVEIL